MDFSKTSLGIELGSTRIKGVLIDESHQVIASGSYGWENKLENGVWTYELANALNVPISTMETAGEGGPWGMALLAAYMVRKADGESMEDYLKNKVFADAKSVSVVPDPAGVAGFETYLERYKAALAAEKAAAAMQ